MGAVCPKCKREVGEKSKFCPNCKNALTKEPIEKFVRWEDDPPKKRRALVSEYLCKNCGQSLQFVQQYNNWYCSKCNIYGPPSLKFPQQASFFCPICEEPINYIDQYSKWHCPKCASYPLTLDHFYLESDEQVQQTFYNCQYCSIVFGKKLLKLSSWQDLGNIIISNRALFFCGKKFWFKTETIKNLLWDQLNNDDISNYIKKSMGKEHRIRLEFQDTSGLLYGALMNVHGQGIDQSDYFKTIELFNYLYSWWGNINKTSVSPTPPPSSTSKPIPIPKPSKPTIIDDKTQIKETKSLLDQIVSSTEDKPITGSKSKLVTNDELAKPLDTQDPDQICIKSAINYEHAKIVYKVKVENNLKTSISDITIKPHFPGDIFILNEEEKNISLIKKGEAKTATFTIRPKGECGNVDVSGRVRYYDTKKDEYHDLNIKPKSTQIICPMLKAHAIEENEWQDAISRLVSVKETTNDVPLSAEELFDMISDVIKDMNMFMLKPKIGRARYVGRFSSEGVKGFKYGVKVEVLGGLQNSKLILNTYSENQECLIGFHHKILDEIEDRTNIKQYIKDPLIIKGDYIASGSKVEIKDSVLQRSKIGTDGKDTEESDVDWD